MRVAPYRSPQGRRGLDAAAGLRRKVIEKTLKITTDRLAPAGAAIIAERRVPHERARARARARRGAQGRRRARHRVRRFRHCRPPRCHPGRARKPIGGRIEHFGMPVDPGNLLLIGDARGHPVLGAPGCARSPKENGFDWVLMRLLAGLPVPREDITGFGVGGLLMEIVTRPQPRVEPAQKMAATSPPSCSPPGIRPAWAGRTSCWPKSAASRWCASRSRRRSPRARGRSSSSPGISASASRRRSRDCRSTSCTTRISPRSRHLAQGRHRRGAGRGRWRHRLPWRHAAGRCRADRSLIAAFDPEKGALVVVPTHRRQARQSGGVVAAFLLRSDGGRGRRWRAPSDRRAIRKRWSRCRSAEGGDDRRRYAGSARGREGRA